MLRFFKMQGCGNDYIFIDCRGQSVPHPHLLARRVSDRHFGVGSDGLILLLPAEGADLAMRIFNADGSEAEMCGNAICGWFRKSSRDISATSLAVVKCSSASKPQPGCAFCGTAPKRPSPW